MKEFSEDYLKVISEIESLRNDLNQKSNLLESKVKEFYSNINNYPFKQEFANWFNDLYKEALECCINVNGSSDRLAFNIEKIVLKTDRFITFDIYSDIAFVESRIYKEFNDFYKEFLLEYKQQLKDKLNEYEGVE